MALRKPDATTDQSTATATASPAFESMEDGSTVEVETSSASAAAAQEAAAPAPTKPAGLPVVKNTSATALALKKGTVLDELQNVIESEMLEGMGFGAFPRITVTPGMFNENKTKLLGSKIEIEILSWNFVTLVTAGTQNDKEADKLIRNSYDGINITDEGTTVEAYIAKLKAMDYDKAGSKMNLLRWVSARASKETFSPPRDWRYPYMSEA